MSNAKNDGEVGWTVIYATIVIVFVCAFLWYVFRHPILEVLRYTRWVEAWLISPFTGQETVMCRNWLMEIQIDAKQPTAHVIDLTKGCFGEAFLTSVRNRPNYIDYYGLTGTSMSEVGRRLAAYYRWPWIVVFGGISAYVIFFSRHSKFKTRHTLESFIKVQALMWPVISPIVNFNPIKASARVPGSQVPDKLPLFAEALSPEEWVAWHRISVANAVPDREATRRAFVQQLGPRWKGIDATPLYIQALIAAFALRGVQRRDESDNLLGRLSLCWSEKGGFVMPAVLKSEVKKLIQDPEVGGKAMEIALQHAYRTTAVLGVLKWARWMGGVLAPAQFLWVRAVDRALWYPLNNLGRRSFHTEGAGALAHFMAEQSAKKPLPIARVDTAIVTLNGYFAQAERQIPLRESEQTPART